MNKIATIAGLAAAATTMSASAEVLLCVDLSVTNTITITATGGLSAATVSGGDSLGFLLADFFVGSGIGIFDTGGVGDLSSAANASDTTPGLFNTASSVGLNVWTYTDEATSDFTSGSVAFSGTATWSLDMDEYDAAILGNTFGDIYAFADSDDDIGAATLLGTWKIVPAPSALALLGLGGIVAGRRRR